MVLKSMGVTVKKAEGEVIRIMGRGSLEGRPDLTFTPRVKALFREAESHCTDEPVEPEDLLRAMILLPRCTGQKVLHALDLDTEYLLLRISKPKPEPTHDWSKITTGKLSQIHDRVRSGSFKKDETTNPEGLRPADADKPGMDTDYPDEMLGKIIDKRYEVLEVLGRGGMGVVYKVNHLVLGRIFAIKVLHPYLASDQKSRQRFQREAQATSRLTHPNLATVFDWALLSDGRPYLVMYYIEGVKLKDLVHARDSVSTESWILIFLQLCDALSHAHNQGVLHRDLKPGNIILSRSGETSHFVKIVDFGIAKFLKEQTSGTDLTETGEVFGSPLYMSPEQCLGTNLDIRSDIYSLGIVMYECLTGSPPFNADSLYEIMRKQVNDQTPRFREVDEGNSVSPEIESIVLRCLVKDPDFRFQSMQALSEALTETLIK